MVVLDANVVLEILEKRARLDAVLAAIKQYENQYTLAVTTLSLSNVFYVLEKNKYDPGIAERLLKTYRFLPVESEDAIWAFEHYQGVDFEDALQVAAAVREGCGVFMTLDKVLARKYRKFLNIQLIS